MSMENRFGEVLATFNSVAGYKAVHLRLELMLEEIRLMLDNDQSDGLQEKACAAIPLWVEWQEWNRVHRNGGELLSGPNVAETDLVLNSAALGSEPRDIMREVMQLRTENGLNDTPGPVDATSTFLDRFNEFAEVKALATTIRNSFADSTHPAGQNSARQHRPNIRQASVKWSLPPRPRHSRTFRMGCAQRFPALATSE